MAPIWRVGKYVVYLSFKLLFQVADILRADFKATVPSRSHLFMLDSLINFGFRSDDIRRPLLERLPSRELNRVLCYFVAINAENARPASRFRTPLGGEECFVQFCQSGRPCKEHP